MNWGIISTGNIAARFAGDFGHVPGAKLTAVASRQLARARDFATRFGIPLAFGSYNELASSPDVDVVYVATPHPFHFPNARMCLEEGKSVLCEKPVTLNANEFRELMALAERKGLFLMEALWSRFLPAYRVLNDLLAEQKIGEVRWVSADFGLAFPYDPAHRLFSPELGGGALLDLGVYPIHLTDLVLGLPHEVKSVIHLAPTGVDESAALLFYYSDGAVASLFCSSRVKTPGEACIAGTKGQIRLQAPFHRTTGLTVQTGDKPAEVRTFPILGNGLHYQVLEVERCLKAGARESPILPWEKSLQIMTLLDRLRHDWGVLYPQEKDEKR